MLLIFAWPLFDFRKQETRQVPENTKRIPERTMKGAAVGAETTRPSVQKRRTDDVKLKSSYAMMTYK